MFLKVLLYDLWRSRINWGDTLQGEAAKNWTRWIKALPDLQNTSIRRCYREAISATVKDVQLHIFCDPVRNGDGSIPALLSGPEHRMCLGRVKDTRSSAEIPIDPKTRPSSSVNGCSFC
uniref:Uncharacterized protein n=1 Tax=Anopheles christyi TaxID=43041 RepID=A0A182KAE7_9DIPT